jgi:hypothetical protein
MPSSILATSGEAIIAVAALLRHREQPRVDQLGQVAARGWRRDMRQRGEFAAGQRLPAHQCREHGGACGVADQRRDLHHVCRRGHA